VAGVQSPPFVDNMRLSTQQATESTRGAGQHGKYEIRLEVGGE